MERAFHGTTSPMVWTAATPHGACIPWNNTSHGVDGTCFASADVAIYFVVVVCFSWSWSYSYWASIAKCSYQQQTFDHLMLMLAESMYLVLDDLGWNGRQSVHHKEAALDFLCHSCFVILPLGRDWSRRLTPSLLEELGMSRASRLVILSFQQVFVIERGEYVWKCSSYMVYVWWRVHPWQPYRSEARITLLYAVSLVERCMSLCRNSLTRSLPRALIVFFILVAISLSREY